VQYTVCSRRVPIALAILVACLAGLLFASAPALAVFSRPFLGEIIGTPTAPFDGVGGIATSPAHVWIGEGGTGLVDEFSSTNEFEASLPGFNTNSLAFDEKSGKLESAPREEWVAVDNSTDVMDPATGDVYRARAAEHGGEVGRVSRVTENGGPAPFTCPAGVLEEKYINARGELDGDPHEQWVNFSHGPVAGIAVNSSSSASTGAGDIYVINNHNSDGAEEVDQFTSTGCFVRALTEAGIPRKPIGPNFLEGVAVDPTDGDLIIAANKQTGTEDEHAVLDELTSEGEPLGQLMGPSSSATFGRAPLDEGVAVNPAGDLYVADTEGDVVDEFGPGAFYPAVVTGEVEDDRSTSAVVTGTFRGAMNEEGQDLVVSGCDFDVVAETVFKTSEFAAAKVLPCVLESGADPVGKVFEEKDYSVHATGSGLSEGETYEYRLVATTDPSELGGTQDGAVESFAAAASPVVRGVSVGNISSSFVDFSSEVDPRGSDTTYQFQYVDAAGYEAALAEHAVDPYAGGASVPVSAADIGSGDRYVSVSVQAGGLAPETTYHYRVVASNAVGVTDGVDSVFATLPAGEQGLPDGRAYELVTPANKGDAEDMFGRINGLNGSVENPDVGYVSEDGDHFLLLTAADFGPFPDSGEGAYVFSRGEQGWSFQSVASPSLGVQAATGLLFDPWDFSTVGVEDDVTLQQEKQGMDLVGKAGGPYAALASFALGEDGEPVTMEGASKDLSHVVVASTDHKLPLCESAQEDLAQAELDKGSTALYEWATDRQCLSLVNVRSGGGKVVSRCGATLGLLSGGFEDPGASHGAVSEAGSTIFFTSPEPFSSKNARLTGSGCWDGSTGNPPQLYMRLNGETTVEVSAPQGVVPKTTYPAIYVGAAENGSRVFFLTKTELTADAVAAKTQGPELYEYNAEAPEGERLVRISRGDLQTGPVEGSVLNVPAISADGSTVYFNAEGNLTPGVNGGGLYRYDTVTGETTYVAPPQGYLGVSWAKNGESITAEWYAKEVLHDYRPGLALGAPYYTTRDGQFLLFGPYRYDAADDSTVCVMCNPNGTGPIPDASFTRSDVENGNLAGGPTRGMSENGEYVFFDTAQPLVPQATNGKIDVYEWHDGRISLISSGQSSSDDFFLDSSSYVTAKGETVEGGNVFFGTHSQLVPTDTDNAGNLYDARICTAEEPCIKPAAGEPVQCEGSSCQTPPAEPIDQTPTSLAFNGLGDVVTEVPAPAVVKKAVAKCKKGFVKKKVKKKAECVKSKGKAKRASHHGRTKR
jgi:hypothetical protein